MTAGGYSDDLRDHEEYPPVKKVGNGNEINFKKNFIIILSAGCDIHGRIPDISDHINGY